MWPFDKNKTDKVNHSKMLSEDKNSEKIGSEETKPRKKDFENLKSDTLKEFDKKVDSLISEHKTWLEQYQRNMKNITESYDRRIKEFDTKVNIVRETLEKNIDIRKDLIESLGKVLDFDKVVKYQTSGIIDFPNDLGDLRALGDGNWEIIILVKRIEE